MFLLSKYKAQLKEIQYSFLGQFLSLSIVAILISLLFAFYALHPLRKALNLLEEFIKDIIHDLNTPITSILINLKMMQKNEEVESIAQSANAIANSSYGIKNPSKVFDRFYKESDRGLGIGLHIVDKLCKELNITKKLEVVDNKVVIVTLIFSEK